MIDADAGSTHNRRLQFARALRAAGEAQLSTGDPIVNLIAKRNVETWILCLNGNIVDELADYRRDRRVTPSAIKEAASSLYEWTRPNAAVPVACVPSLRECLPEFERVPV